MVTEKLILSQMEQHLFITLVVEVDKFLMVVHNQHAMADKVVVAVELALVHLYVTVKVKPIKVAVVVVVMALLLQ